MAGITIPQSLKTLESYTIEARDRGVGQAQLSLFVNAGYVALPWMLAFHAAARQADEQAGPVMLAVGGARGPGKSHGVMAQVGLDDCQRVEGLKVLFLRSVQKTAAESMDDLTRRVFAHVPHTVKRSPYEVTFPVTDSRILIGGYRTERDIEKYLGIEYDLIVVEEATQVKPDALYDKVRGSLRTSKPNWRPRMYLSTNPGSIGHAEFKRRFVMPWREKRETQTRFFPATYRDNPFLNLEYIEYLEELKGTLGKAWRDGDWDVFEGIAFPEFGRETHTCRPFALPEHWPKWRGLDWGTGAPFGCGWMARDTDTGRVYVYREVYQKGMTDRQQARLVRDSTPANELIATTYADPSMWSAKNLQGVWGSSADEYAAEGVVLTKANNDRVQGKRNVQRMLANLPDGRPGLVIFETCEHLVDQMENLVSAGNNPEDVDTDQEDHAYDYLRYGLTHLPSVEQQKRSIQRNRLARVSGL